MFELKEQIIKTINHDIEEYGFSICHYDDVVRCLARHNLIRLMGSETHPALYTLDIKNVRPDSIVGQIIDEAKVKFRALCIEHNWLVIEETHQVLRISIDEFRIRSKREINGFTAHQAASKGMMDIHEYVCPEIPFNTFPYDPSPINIKTKYYQAKEYSRKLPNIFSDDNNRGYEFLWLWLTSCELASKPA